MDLFDFFKKNKGSDCTDKCSAQYAVAISPDRLATDADIDELHKLGALPVAMRALTLQISMGNKRDILAQSSNIIAENQFRTLAKQQWEGKGISVSESEIRLKKFILKNGGLFVVATVQ